MFIAESDSHSSAATRQRNDRKADYDAVNRLGSVQETGTTGWQETFGYDKWRNRWVNPALTSGIVLSPNTPTASSWFIFAEDTAVFAWWQTDILANRSRGRCQFRKD